MRIWTFSRTKRELIPFTCKLSQLGGKRYVVWGRFRIRVLGKPTGPVFSDQYEIHTVNCAIRSRNDITIRIGDMSEADLAEGSHIVALHLVLSKGYKGKCIKAVNGKRILYDYKKKGDSPSGYFSIMAFVSIPKNEIVTAVDYVDGEETEIVFSNVEGKLSYK